MEDCPSPLGMFSHCTVSSFGGRSSARSCEMKLLEDFVKTKRRSGNSKGVERGKQGSSSDSRLLLG